LGEGGEGFAIIHLNMCGSQTNFQQFLNGFRLQGRPFCQSVIVMEFIADDLQGFIDQYISKHAGARTDRNV
jgi:hypothetical protein